MRIYQYTEDGVFNTSYMPDGFIRYNGIDPIPFFITTSSVVDSSPEIFVSGYGFDSINGDDESLLWNYTLVTTEDLPTTGMNISKILFGFAVVFIFAVGFAFIKLNRKNILK